MDTRKDVLAILDEVLGMNGRSSSFSDSTPLLGAIPELDSMAVVTIIATLEERFDITIDDDEIDGAAFENVGALVRFVSGKLGA